VSSASTAGVRPDARSILLRAIAGAVSNEELDHLVQLALAHPGRTVTAEVERTIGARRREIDSERQGSEPSESG
jgi:hypothetical protein